MSRRRVQSAPAVSLFPFLAVLVCAMGSLILLLLVISRHVRPQAKITSAAQVAETFANSDQPNLQQFMPEAVAEVDPIVIPVMPAVIEEPFLSPEQIVENAPDAIPFVSQRDASLAQQLAVQQLQTEQDQQQRQLSDLQKQLRQIETQKQQLLSTQPRQQAEMRQLQQQLTRLRQQQVAELTLHEQTSRELSQLQLKLTTLQSEQTKLEQAGRERKDKWQVVAYDGSSGVQKEPIFLECRLGEVVLHPENVAISIQDLETLSPETSPLVFAIRAIQKYRSQQGRSAEPYVLMVGRPTGISEFYTCGQILTFHRIPFGYELIGQSQELYFGPADPVARVEIQDAIDQALLQAPVPRGRFARMHSPASGNGRAVSGLPGETSPQLSDSSGIQPPTSSAGQLPAQPSSSQSRQSDGISKQGISIDQFLANQRQQQRQRLIPQEVAPLTKTPPPPPAAASEFPRRPPQLSASGQQSGSSGSSAITLERSIAIKLYADGCQIGRQEYTKFPASTDTEQFQLWLLQRLETEVQNWEAAPAGISWKPVLKMQVGPGGNTAALRLEELAARMDIDFDSAVLFEQTAILPTDIFPDR